MAATQYLVPPYVSGARDVPGPSGFNIQTGNNSNQPQAASTLALSESEISSLSPSSTGPEDRPLPLCNRSDNSDANPESPWSRKIILSLDGGGVRGYSSLLILKRLFYLIKQIELGQREGYVGVYPNPSCEEPKLTTYGPNQSSSEYPWFVPLLTGDEPMKVEQEAGDKIEDEDDDEDAISKSVDETFLSTTSVSQFKPHHYFDYIAGTSTGGLSAMMLSRMEMDIDKALQQYTTIGNAVFAKPRHLHTSIKGFNALRPKYPTKNMEKALQDVIEVGIKEELEMQRTSAQDVSFASNPSRCRTIAVAHGPADERNAVKHKYLFRSYEHPHPSPFSTLRKHELHYNPGPAHREPIWKIARATSAAPLYFRTIAFGNRRFRDGGMVANNPAELALNEAIQMHEQRPRLLISVGTGAPDPDQEPKQKSTSRRNFSYIKDGWNTISLMKDLITQSEDTHESVTKLIDVMAEDNKVEYHRFNAGNGMKNILLDEWDPKDGSKTLNTLQDLTIKHLKEPETHMSLLQCARTLVVVRRQRATTERWESYATGYVYYCHVKTCTKVARAFKTREALRLHIYDAHDMIWDTPISNDHGLKYACFWDQCQHDGVYVFQNRDAYLDHLRNYHKFERDPVFKNRAALENWLDHGRKGHREAFDFIANQRTMTLKANAKNQPPQADKGGSISAASGSDIASAS
ncbi:FabD/lysophospholipase-like protein [Lojkania enalia]|uniref:FabD/lysophospholipase-like protein n=1 Tax=Lojkania enalia TaxID=147567 RepID=A0A9P4MZ10_9PLEO|nr:FabD/lysophospholipase-like protein [Didymosphaeria enalia]